jgi:NDP-sugar pyrophosphorylase family protein
MFTGIHILEPRIFDYIPPSVFSDSVTNVYLPAIAKGERIAAHVAEGMWYELSTLNRYLDISLALLRQRGMDLYSGCNPSIDKAADVHDAVLWDDVNIENGAHVRRAVLGDGVRIRSGERIEDAVVVRAELVSGMTPPPKALKGLVDGDNFVVQLSQ